MGLFKGLSSLSSFFWKTIKIILENEGFRCAGPRSCIKEGARRGALSEGETLLDMLEDRNKSSHIYDKATTDEIFERVKQTYVVLIEKNIVLFKQYIDIEMA